MSGVDDARRIAPLLLLGELDRSRDPEAAARHFAQAEAIASADERRALAQADGFFRLAAGGAAPADPTVKVAAGDTVTAGQPVASIEAMKMEAAITSPVGGVVERVVLAATASVEAGDLLLVVRPAD